MFEIVPCTEGIKTRTQGVELVGHRFEIVPCTEGIKTRIGKPCHWFYDV